MRYLTAILMLLLAAPARAEQWTAGALTDPKADVYPSHRVAGEAMANLFAQTLKSTPNFNENSGRILLPAARTEPESTVVNALRARLQRQLPRAMIQAVIGATDAKPIDATIKIAISDATPQNHSRVPGYRCKMQGTLTIGEQTTRFDTVVIDKLWVADGGVWANLQPDRQWVVGRSSQTCLTESEAQQAARKDAARQLWPLIQTRMAEASTYMPPTAGQAMILNQLQGGAVADQFVQRIERTAGPTFQAAILVPSDQNAIASLMPAIVSVARQERKQTLSTAGAVVVMAIVITVIYCFLNAATRGFFTWRLRFGALCFMVIGAMVLLMSLWFVARKTLQVESRPAEITIETHM